MTRVRDDVDEMADQGKHERLVLETERFFRALIGSEVGRSGGVTIALQYSPGPDWFGVTVEFTWLDGEDIEKIIEVSKAHDFRVDLMSDSKLEFTRR